MTELLIYLIWNDRSAKIDILQIMCAWMRRSMQIHAANVAHFTSHVPWRHQAGRLSPLPFSDCGVWTNEKINCSLLTANSYLITNRQLWRPKSDSTVWSCVSAIRIVAHTKNGSARLCFSSHRQVGGCLKHKTNIWCAKTAWENRFSWSGELLHVTGF